MGQAASRGKALRGSAPIFTASIRLSIASTVRCAGSRQQSLSFPFFARCVGKLRKTIRFTHRTERTIPTSRYGSGDIVEMEHSKLANGNGHRAQIGRSASSAQQDQMSTVRSAGKKAVRKKTASRKAKLARPLPKKMGSESKSNRLVCRYCGSEDLAPSFIKRRDRRCRKCFSKRYGSAARAKKAKVKK
jgi:hypothetical protein